MTVVTFHRVLRRNDPRWETALSPWTLADDTFDQCLMFFRSHYTIVTLDDVKASVAGARPLPPRCLLITFDDGFADNLEYALPLLRKHAVFATIFVTSDVIGRQERLWTEDLLWAFTAGRVRPCDLARLHALLLGQGEHDPDDPKLIWDIVRRGPELDDEQVQAAFSGLNIDLHRITWPRQMLTRDGLAHLVASGVSIGAHGKTHTAMTSSSDVATELSRPRAVLNDIVIAQGQSSVDALSVPHGAYTSGIVNQALAAGYALVFTGDPVLSTLKNGFLVSPLIGRLDVDGRRIAPTGDFLPEVLAASLFTASQRQSGVALQFARPARHSRFASMAARCNLL
ncbi:polysaccharide deacetylase family protein [Bradyrhizobium sp. AS23.2]|uniref:polysaccharide deacetylase family protein n=1 Tax=Bradyrhizobium sp. AS23.2 TaxID=1680155 RepID=UPI00142F4028|nr:polysaccharide deacetylase family protein [Bradyrhizobium sp. AS23.2]